MRANETFNRAARNFTTGRSVVFSALFGDSVQSVLPTQSLDTVFAVVLLGVIAVVSESSQVFAGCCKKMLMSRMTVTAELLVSLWASDHRVV